MAPLLAACAVDPSEGAPESSDSAFAVSPGGRSLLPAIASSHGAISVCVGLIGFDASTRPIAETKIEGLVATTTNLWNDLLRDNPHWSVQRIQPSVTFRSTECPAGGQGFNVNVWGSVSRFQAEYCSRPGRTCASSALVERRTIVLGPWNRTEAVDPFEPFAMLHEYGHLLGLGDTYRIPGMNDWYGTQPPSVMSGGSRTLTNDDKLGLWVVLREITTGVRSCEGFGGPVLMTYNTWQNLMCDPASVPVTTGARPRLGTWAYDGQPVARTGMLILQITESATGFEQRLGLHERGLHVPLAQHLSMQAERRLRREDGPALPHPRDERDVAPARHAQHSERSRRHVQPLIVAAHATAGFEVADRFQTPWLEVDREARRAIVTSLPDESSALFPLRTQLVVELYSQRR